MAYVSHRVKGRDDSTSAGEASAIALPLVWSSLMKNKDSSGQKEGSVVEYKL